MGQRHHADAAQRGPQGRPVVGSPDSPIEPTSPAEPLNTGVFLFKGNRASYNVEMRNI